MAKLIYAVLALALASLVGGFLVRSSALPLIASIVLSAVVVVLILVGHSRRLRRMQRLDDEGEEEEADLEVVDLDEEPEPRVIGRARRGRSESVPDVLEATRAMDLDEDDAPEAPAAPVRGKASASRGRRASPEASEASVRVVVIPGRSRFHTASCRFAKGDDLREVSEATARRRGYEPCSVCNPGA